MIERLLRLVGRWARKPVNHTSWVAVVTPTDRPKSVRNRFLIELFCGVVWVVALPFWHFCWCRGFCHRTESDLFLFLMVPLEVPYPDVYTDTFIFFLRSLCKIIWINVHYFPNAPRIYRVFKTQQQSYLSRDWSSKRREVIFRHSSVATTYKVPKFKQFIHLHHICN